MLKYIYTLAICSNWHHSWRWVWQLRRLWSQSQNRYHSFWLHRRRTRWGCQYWIEKELPTIVKDTCQSLFSESEWPTNIKPCLDFNKGSCDKTILHDTDTIHTRKKNVANQVALQDVYVPNGALFPNGVDQGK